MMLGMGSELMLDKVSGDAGLQSLLFRREHGRQRGLTSVSALLALSHT